MAICLFPAFQLQLNKRVVLYNFVLMIAVSNLLVGCASEPSLATIGKDSTLLTNKAKTKPYNKPYKIKGKTYIPLQTASGYKARGIASWYGSGSGNRTASGVRFDPRGLTAAHKTLPIPSKVRVTNLRNGRSVDVIINDRGPFVGNRLIDLSKGAAEQIGMKGLAEVAIEYIGG